MKTLTSDAGPQGNNPNDNFSNIDYEEMK